MFIQLLQAASFKNAGPPRVPSPNSKLNCTFIVLAISIEVETPFFAPIWPSVQSKKAHHIISSASVDFSVGHLNLVCG